MTYVEKHRFAGSLTEQTILKLAWEGEIFGVGMFETLTLKFPEHAEILTAAATMEWLNVHLLEDFGHAGGVQLTVEEAENLGRAGAEFGRKSGSFETMARLTIAETAAVDPLFERLAKGAGSPELAEMGKGLVNHENALRDWLRPVLAGTSNGGEGIFAYLEQHGISREAAITPRQRRDDIGGDRQQLVLASFLEEADADEAARVLRNWENATEYMKVDGIGVLVKDENGKIKQHKLGKTAGKKGMGIGVALGLIAAIPTGGLSLVGGAVGGGVGGDIIGHFFHKGLAITDEDMTRIDAGLDSGQAVVGVLTWDFESEAVTKRLVESGGTPRTIEVVAVASRY